MGADLLQALQVLTELVVQDVGQHLGGLAVLVVTLSVQEPVGDLVLTGILHDGDKLLNLFLSEFSSSPGQGDVGLLETQVGVTTSNTLDRGQGEHDAGLAINVGVENTKNVLEVWRNHQRHLEKFQDFLLL